jgi:hypothetical protein
MMGNVKRRNDREHEQCHVYLFAARGITTNMLRILLTLTMPQTNARTRPSRIDTV